MREHHCLTLYISNTGQETHLSPCECNCSSCKEYRRVEALPDLTDKELEAIWMMIKDCTPGPWKAKQLQGWGVERFIISESNNWFRVIAHLQNAGSFNGDTYVAWARDGVPRLIKLVDKLQAEIDELRSGIKK